MAALHPGDGLALHPLQDCEAGIKLEPVLVKLQLRRADALKSLGKVEEAAEAYTGVLSLKPDSEEAKEGLKECHLMSGNKSDDSWWL